jgi:membrane protease YdiL (CAAX protease family)
MISSSIELIFIFGLIAFLINWFAFSRGFYKTSWEKEGPDISLKQFLCVFGIYLGFSIFVIPFFVRFLQYLSSPLFPSMTLVSFVQVFLLLTMVFWLFRFVQSQKQNLLGKIFKDSHSPITQDLGVGALAWTLSFPIIVVVGQFFDLILYLIFGVETYEQVPVRYFKESLASFPQTLMAVFTILVLAPVVEEFLFRGCLQNYFKKILGTRSAIFLTAFCFALFHFSYSQGLGNVSLIASLFVLACFLGFVYEKRQSLYASIGLHMTFNLISTVRILLFSEG